MKEPPSFARPAKPLQITESSKETDAVLPNAKGASSTDSTPSTKTGYCPHCNLKLAKLDKNKCSNCGKKIDNPLITIGGFFYMI